MPCWNILPGRIPSFSTYLNIRNPFSHLSKCSLVFGVLLGLFKITEVSAPGPANSVDSGGVEYYDGDEIDEKAGHQVDPYAPGSSVPLAPLRVTQPFCSFFDNRSPQMQPDLRNCTWYRERSCCRQAELESIFKKVKPLQGASENCMRHLNYMICWVCDPVSLTTASHKKT
ncbi:hypothetical protein RvY_05936-1 [Ramazzottius varieornatus]|uniref:Folate receptor-like domain-containing protein n=1 Tax=Ramazzottius varieornatus TaxID=947166 RepID=A0A1D1V0C1_RAMVA|nr:hypothetical protein RvY_05936-1 [Ramazzottius varieornatus]